MFCDVSCRKVRMGTGTVRLVHYSLGFDCCAVGWGDQDGPQCVGRRSNAVGTHGHLVRCDLEWPGRRRP
jgi:hypothetical protein